MLAGALLREMSVQIFHRDHEEDTMALKLGLMYLEAKGEGRGVANGPADFTGNRFFENFDSS